MDTREQAEMPSPTFQERALGRLCNVVHFESEAFDGSPDEHYLAIPVAAGLDTTCAVAEKVVPLGAPAESVPWERIPEFVEC